MKTNRFFVSLFVLLTVTTLSFSQTHYSYSTVPNDPMHTRMYTLQNGLKVYLSVNKQEPRIQTYIAVHVGSKNDPAETTGLAHYLEHLMFKGTNHFGTSNYSVEKPLLDQIRQLYETYRHTTDLQQRKAIYHQIDSISYEASKYSIANEYDKLMTAIGSKNSNAFTSNDCTVYQENIPSNQVENWAKIQSERFNNAVIRGFHTELEAVYEEYNISLAKDEWQMWDSLYVALYPNHPYGHQTTLGTQEHLKNPSIINIDNYFHKYYVPNNIAICMSGDFDPDQAIAVIDKYFSVLKPNNNLPKFTFEAEVPITQPVVKKVVGQEAEQAMLAWRFPAQRALSTDTLTVLDLVMNNGQAGLLDLDIMQKQKMVKCYGSCDELADYCAYIMGGTPKEGQSLDDVKTLLLQEIEKLKKGDFSEDLLKGALNNYKLRQMQILENNTARAYMLADAFTHDVPWSQQVNLLNRLSKISKADIVAFANRHFGNNYAIVYKIKGENKDQKKIDKPAISPILTNRDKTSDYLLSIQKSTVKPIEPRFPDFNKELSKTTIKSLPFVYEKNTTNDVFTLIYLWKRGKNNDKYMPLAFSYLDYLNSPKMTADEFQSKLYALGCSLQTDVQNGRTYVMISGLSENMKQAMALVEYMLSNVTVNKEAYGQLVQNNIKRRADDKLSQESNFDKLTSYVLYDGKQLKNVVSNEEMQQLNPQLLVNRIHNLLSYKHDILYYGPMAQSQSSQLIALSHHTPKVMKALPTEIKYTYADMRNNKVYIAPYDAKNFYMSMIATTSNNLFNVEEEPYRTMYNNYFGGSMNSIVFQELRESRALAYSAWALYNRPDFKGEPYSMRANIISQNDKAPEAMSAYHSILNNMPVAQSNFDLAKQNVISNLRAKRVFGQSLLWSYMDALDMGLNYDINKYIYEKVQNMTLQDVLNFQQKYIKGASYHTAILGNEKDLNMNAIGKYGTIVRLTQKDIFGY